jgi:hypothetical protein
LVLLNMTAADVGQALQIEFVQDFYAEAQNEGYATVIPEPSTLLLFSSGLFFLSACRRRHGMAKS